MINSLLDDVLDRTLLAGYTNVGYRIRSRGWWASELARMDGKVVLITGASSGLGFATAEGCARLGAAVWLLVRSEQRGEQARMRIVQRSGNSDVHVGLCDLSNLESVRQFAGRFRDHAPRLDVAGRKNELTYRIVEYDPPRAVTFLGENATVISRDRITVKTTTDGTRITYDADLALKGPLRIADPLLGRAFTRVGDRALAGLKRTLAPAQPHMLRSLPGRALDGKAYELPSDLAKQHNLIVVAFRREQQRLVDEWLPSLIDLEQRGSDVAVYELAVRSSLYGPARWLIDGGMTRGIPDASARARTITVYTDVAKVVDNLALPGTDTIAVVLIERSGRILASEFGGFEQQKADGLAAALAPISSPDATGT